MPELSSNAMQIASKRYFIRENEGWENLSKRVGYEIGRMEKDNKYIELFSEIIYNMDFIPAGRVLRNSGRPAGSLLNCYAIIVGDSIREIAKWKGDSLILWSEGGGVGCNISSLRPEDALILGKGGKSSGPISFLKASDGDANTIKSGGSRRAAGLALLMVTHPDIVKFINAKTIDGVLKNYNISVGITEDFIDAVETDSEWTYKFNQKDYGAVSAREIWNLILENMIKYAEPGLIHWDNLRENNSYYFSSVVCTNPCFAGDTKIVTKQGHYEIQDLVGKSVDIWDGNKWVNINNFRITGIDQPMLKIGLYDGTELRVTPYHKFYLENGVSKEAKDLLINDKLEVSNTPISHGIVHERGAYLKGFLLGDGSTSKQQPLLWLYEPKFCLEDRLIKSAKQLPIIQNNTNTVLDLEFKNNGKNVKRKFLSGLTARNHNLNKWCHEYKTNLPKEVFQWNLDSKCEFIAGYFDADGNISDNKHGFCYAVWANSKQLLLDIQLLLKTIGVCSKLCYGKKACKQNFNDGYGDYNCKESFRLVVSQKNSIELSNLIKFSRLKSFKHKTVKYNIKPKFNKVVSIVEDGIDEEVYCCTVPTSHKIALSLGILSGQCGEAALGNYEACDLGSLVLTNFVTNINTNWKKLKQTIDLAVRFLDNVLDVNKYVLNEVEVSSHAGRRIGIGVMGLAEYLFAKKIKYGSDKAIYEIEKLMRFMRDSAYEASIKLAVEKGAFPKFDTIPYSKSRFIRKLPASLRMDIKSHGIRNVSTMAIAPTGTISLLSEVTPSTEPLFAKAYVRKDEVSERYYIHPLLQDIVKEGKETPEWFVDSFDIEPKDHFDVQVAVQKYTDGAVSKTINLPKGTTAKQLDKLMLENINDLKGVTTYVDGSREGQIINKLNDKEIQEAIKSGKVTTEMAEEDVTCASGSCDI